MKNNDQKYMYRCLQLARKGLRHVSPNPMVGAVIVCNGKIIGEGYHRCCGLGHAEVNAIASVKDKSKLSQSTMYVSLEPCSHYGKTPPCADLIVSYGIPRVVIASLDPYPAVSGRGVAKLRKAGITVEIGILEKEALELNKAFMTVQSKKRRYIYLKWAQSKDGFIARKNEAGEVLPTPISNSFTQLLVHKKRAESDAIMIGTNTAVTDNPQLSTRLWAGKNPVRIVFDRSARIPKTNHIFDHTIPTIVFTEVIEEEKAENNLSFIPVKFDKELLKNVFSQLAEKDITSVMVEGGSILLQNLIDQGLWDEAFVEVSDSELFSGVKSPHIVASENKVCRWYGSTQHYLRPIHQT